ncbi:MAG: hypothetical protein ABIH23_00060 [bacterium]
MKEAMKLKRDGALEWVDVPDVSDLNFSAANEYLCNHPNVVDENPVTGESTCVYCYKARAPGLCGKQGVYWVKKGTKDGVLPEKAVPPSPTATWIYETTKEVEDRWHMMCLKDPLIYSDANYHGGVASIELFARMMLKKIGAKVPER